MFSTNFLLARSAHSLSPPSSPARGSAEAGVCPTGAGCCGVGVTGCGWAADAGRLRARRLTESALGPEPTSAWVPASTSGVSAAPVLAPGVAGVEEPALSLLPATAIMGVPTSTVSPSAASSCSTVPSYGEGSSTTDLAVSISTSTSLMCTVSPGATFQARISASVSPSPTSGRLKIWDIKRLSLVHIARKEYAAGWV